MFKNGELRGVALSVTCTARLYLVPHDTNQRNIVNDMMMNLAPWVIQFII